MLGKLIGSVTTFYSKTAIVWFFIIGLACLIQSAYKIFNLPEHLNSILLPIGIAALSGGVFSSLLKSYQFMGIFQEALFKIVFSTEFLKNRRDLPHIWEGVSRVLYNEKFPQISKRIEKAVFETYFPTKFEYYYQDYHHELSINLIDGWDDYVEVYENTRFFIIPNSIDTEIDLNYGGILDKVPGDELTCYELLKFEVNKKNFIDQCEIINESEFNNGKEFKTSFNCQLSGSSQYLINKNDKKIYSTKLNPEFTYRFRRFVNDVEVHFKFPKNMSIKFVQMGILDEFQPLGEIYDNLIWKRLDGLIFPMQGYMIVYTGS